ncbi:MAG: TetR/AcrR family transcriptional regulator [Enterococcus faecalis]|nr:TetR/AcrR family transcriptional regulator [Enterococcus faecalis]
MESGLSHFEKEGFQQTKIRQLCLTAGVTTGAFYKHFTSKEALFEEINNEEFTKYLLNLENIDIEKSWRENFNELDPFINYIFENKRIFDLVLFQSAGTKYQDIVEKITSFVTKKTVCCLDKLKTIGMINQNLVFNEEEIHFYIYSFYATFYDILKHSYSKEKTMLLTRRLYRFSVPGWIELLS